MQDVEDGLGQEVEPAEVHRAVEQRDAVLVAVLVEQGHHLGPGEQPVGDLDGLARGHRHGVAAIVGLVAVALDLMAEAGLQRHVLLRHQRGQPVFVGDAQPAAGARELDLTLLGDVGVFPLLQPVAQHADRALVQDVVAQRRRRAPAADQAVGVEGDRLVGAVGDGAPDREHVVGVELDPLGEAETLAVVPAEGDPVLGRQLAALRRPNRLRPGHGHARVTGHPAVFGEVGVGSAGRAQQHDLGRGRIDRLAVAGQGDVVDAAALERDRAVDGAVVDADPRRIGERIGARQCPAAACGPGHRHAGRLARSGRRHGLRARFGLLCRRTLLRLAHAAASRRRTGTQK